MSEQEIESKARQMGWVPKENFRGSEEQWVDAEEFVRRGEEILPIVRANNRKLQDQLSRQEQQIADLTKAVTESNESLTAFHDYHQESLTRALADQREKLMDQLEQARESGDVRAEIKAQDQLAEVREQERVLKAKPKEEPKPEPTTSQNREDPEFTAWRKDNDWYGVDKKKTAFADGMAMQLRRDPENSLITGRAFYDLVAKTVEEEYAGGSTQRANPDKVAGSRTTSTSRAKSYNDMPAEAKAACDKFAKQLVGPNRAYKDMDSWRKKYAEDFFAGE